MMSDLVMQIYKEMDRRGLKQYVEEADPRRIVNWIVAALETAQFKARVEGFLELELHRAMRKDPVAVVRWITGDLKYFLEYSTEDWSKKPPKSDEKSRWKKKDLNEVSTDEKTRPKVAEASRSR